MITMTILVNDQCAKSDAVVEHGFSAFVETGRGTILFDTGQTGYALSHNARVFGVNLDAISAVAVSHGHYDHTGGLMEVFQGRDDLPLFLHPAGVHAKYRPQPNAPAKPIGMPDECVRLIGQLGPRAHWTTAPTEIAAGIWLTGAIPRRTTFEDTGGKFCLDADCRTTDGLIDDQALWFNTREGIVVLLGCAHAGVVNTLDYIAEIAGVQCFHAVIGGMHLLSAGEDRLRKTVSALQRYQTQLVAPCHCTGDKATDYLVEHLGSRCKPCSAGSRFEWAVE